MEIRDIVADFGSEIDGIDLSQRLDPYTSMTLQKLLDERQLLVFRNQDITPEQQISVVETFGPVCDELDDGKRWSLISSEVTELVPRGIELIMHSDFTFTPSPYPVISLYALEISGPVVPTKFASPRSSYARLPEDLREQLAGLTAIHAVDIRPGRSPEPRKRVTMLDVGPEVPESAFAKTEHPLLKTHPRTGEPIVFVNPMLTSHIKGMDAANSEATLQRCFDIIYEKTHMYEHQWRKGDLVVWDNLGMQHGRDPEIPGGRRHLRRVAVNPWTMAQLMNNEGYAFVNEESAELWRDKLAAKAM
jgi:taurine dioxygenase